MSADAISRHAVLAVVAATLVLVPAPGVVGYTSGGGDDGGDRTLLESWKGLKANLSAGDVAEARSTYQSAFAPHADNRTAAKTAVEDGFDAAENASSTDGPDYAVASQQIRKSLLAVAWANVQVAADQDDPEAADAWASILGTKFGGDVADAADTLGNATADELPEATAELREALVDTVTRKVTHETRETPDLTEAGSDEAPAEAAEARYYASIILPDIEATLGADDASTLRAELDELLLAAQEGDADTASAEAREILDEMARYTLLEAPREKAEAHADVKAALEAEDVAKARTAYQDAFGEAAHEYARDAHDRILTAFGAAENASADGDEAAYTEAEQLVAKGILEAAFEVAFTEFAEEEFHEALEYYAVVAAKFGWFDSPSDAALAAGEAAALDEAGDAVDRAKTGTSEKLLDKVREEVEEVFINWDDPEEAREKAAEGLAYYQPARDHVVTVLGSSPDEHLNQELQVLLNATADRNRTAAEAAANETKTLLDQVEAGGEEVSDLDALVSDLRGKIDFVLTEWRGYYEAKEAGEAGEAETERGEAIAFARNARDLAVEKRATLEEGDADATDELVTILQDLPGKLEANASLETIRTDVEDALDALDRIQRGQLEGTVTVVLGPPEAGDAPREVRVPVTLEGLPDDGGAFQATVSFDGSVLEATDVEVQADVGAGTTGDGEVRFNAALTEAGGPVEVAVLVFETQEPPEEVGEVSLDVDVTELADAQGEALGLAGIEGDSVDVAAAQADADGAPGPGAAAALAVLAAVGMALAAARKP